MAFSSPQTTQHTRSRSLTAPATLPNEQAVTALFFIQHILDANRLTWSDVVGHHPDFQFAGFESGNASGKKGDPNEGLLWNVLISAAARQEEALQSEVKEKLGWALLFLKIDRDLRKATYDLVENTIIDLTVLVVVVFSVVLVQIDTKAQPAHILYWKCAH